MEEEYEGAWPTIAYMNTILDEPGSRQTLIQPSTVSRTFLICTRKGVLLCSICSLRLRRG